MTKAFGLGWYKSGLWPFWDAGTSCYHLRRTSSRQKAGPMAARML